MNRPAEYARMRLVIVAMVTLAALLIDCAPRTGAIIPGTDAPWPGGPKHITTAIRSAPASLAQQRTQRPDNTVRGLDAVEELLHAGLTYVKDDGSRLPLLAEKVPTLENGLWRVFPDGHMEMSWTLKPKVHWQDG